METAILEKQSEVQEYVKRRNCKKLWVTSLEFSMGTKCISGYVNQHPEF
jgi:hypothetical protein